MCVDVGVVVFVRYGVVFCFCLGVFKGVFFVFVCCFCACFFGFIFIILLLLLFFKWLTGRLSDVENVFYTTFW